MTNHRPHHWIAVALVILLALLVLRDVHGQAATGSAAMFEGRPAGDLVASNAAAERDIVRKDRDQVAGENRGALRKTQRALKRTVQRTRHGVAPLDSSS